MTILQTEERKEMENIWLTHKPSSGWVGGEGEWGSRHASFVVPCKVSLAQKGMTNTSAVQPAMAILSFYPFVTFTKGREKIEVSLLLLLTNVFPFLRES